MRGDTETIKERLDIAEIASQYVKIERAGSGFKARCPFHNEKTPSFFISPVRQSFYCFGCGAKGDIFTLVQELEGLSFLETLKMLAEKAGIEIDYRPEAVEAKTEKDKIRSALEKATQFFENQLLASDDARKYLASRDISESSQKFWRLGYAPAEWRALYNSLLQAGFNKDILVKAGLIKEVTGGIKEPYDVFRDRIIFPLADSSGSIIAFSGRALTSDAQPKYLNSPDTILFTKSGVLYGLDKAKDKSRRKNYAVLVEGQVDLVLSHQVGVDNTVASSGTAFTIHHLERLKKLSNRIILAFDGDRAGEVAAEKAAELALSLGLEVKVARLPEGKDPADVVRESPDKWKEILRNSKPAVEHFLERVIEGEKDKRKVGKLIEYKILPLITLLGSSMERSHFVSLIAKHTGIKEDIVWEDLKKAKKPDVRMAQHATFVGIITEPSTMTPLAPVGLISKIEMIQERLTVVNQMLEEKSGDEKDQERFHKEKIELEDNLLKEQLGQELNELSIALSRAEISKDVEEVGKLTKNIQDILKNIRAIEDRSRLGDWANRENVL